MNRNQQITFFEKAENVPHLIQRRTEQFNAFPPKNQTELLPAWDRYDGRIYRRLKEHQGMINNLITNHCLDIIIVSALYGVINFNTPICNYDLEMKANNFWSQDHVIGHAINLYCQQNHIDNTYSFLREETYKRATTGIDNNIWHWPLGLRGANNINNHLADLIIERLNIIAAENNL